MAAGRSIVVCILIAAFATACGGGDGASKPAPSCGDGTVNDGEACDDGNGVRRRRLPELLRLGVLRGRQGAARGRRLR